MWNLNNLPQLANLNAEGLRAISGAISEGVKEFGAVALEGVRDIQNQQARGSGRGGPAKPPFPGRNTLDVLPGPRCIAGRFRGPGARRELGREAQV